jgi:hypothetical protein
MRRESPARPTFYTGQGFSRLGASLRTAAARIFIPAGLNLDR